MSTTYLQFKTKIELDLDLQEETFIQDSELLGYTNEARREVEAEVLGIYEDYLLDSAYLPLVLGTSRYNLPSGIYAEKMRGIIYNNGSIIYEIKRIRGASKFLTRALILSASPTDYYQYLILNNATNGIQIELSPASKETSATNVQIYFLRAVPEITGNAGIIDAEIPGSLNFMYALVKGKCKQKENSGSMPPDAQAEIEFQRKLMVETLSNMVPDDDSEVIQDHSFYNESS